jgi:RNA polymerase sigma-70 factor (ECF subfamily)
MSMATGQDNSLIRHLRRAALLREAGDLTDGQLLERFLTAREEAAFEVLVRRHGPMVLGVCCRVLSNVHDAEDAFQAAFLVLIRKGRSLLPRQTLGNWLYGVAYYTALKARAASWKRRAKERQAVMSRPQAPAEDIGHDLLPLLDRELNRLPDKYREAIVLCELEGKTREEAARQLGVPTGTLSGRLTTARRMLAQRFTRRGVTLSSAALATVLTPSVTSACVPPALVGSTLKAAAALAAGQAAAGALPAEVAALMHGMLKSMLLAKLKRTTAVLLTALALSGSAGVFAYRVAGSEAGPREANGSSLQPDARDAVRRIADLPQEQPMEAAPKLDDKEDTIQADKERLQGVWVPVKAIINGKASDPNDKMVHSLTLIFDDNVAAFWDGKGPYTLAPEKKPKQLDIEVHRKDRKELVQAIYQFDGDRLVVSWMKGSGERPPDFETFKKERVCLVYEKRKR